MTSTEVKTRSTSRFEIVSPAPEAVGEVLAEIRRRQQHVTGVETAAEPAAFSIPEAFWQHIDPSFAIMEPMEIRLRLETSTREHQADEPAEGSREAISAEAWLRMRGEVTGEEQGLFATEPEEEIELYLKPLPKRVTKVTAKIVRRTKARPNPIID